MADETTEPGWTITTQQETTAPDQSGRYVPGVRIGFRTREGISGTVFVPDTQYTPENVRALVTARVVQMLLVGGLQG